VLVLDAGGVSRLAEGSRRAAALLMGLQQQHLWPAIVPSVVLVECLRGKPGFDAPTNQLLKACDVVEELPEQLARRAAELRTAAGRGSAVDAVVVAMAEHGGVVLTSDRHDIAALAEHADDVAIEHV